MESFTRLSGVAAPLALDNVDTDKILPGRYLKTIKRTGLGIHLFESLRYDSAGRDRPDFILNQTRFRSATVLVAGSNFGCGSSREHAPWALLDFGIRCIIAPSFADIFHANCFKNGMLPVQLAQGECDALMEHARTADEPTVQVDLERRSITAGERRIVFCVDEMRRHCLLNGLDDIDLTLERELAIARHEQLSREVQPWLPTLNAA
jgi:3-isopropylmalate/(R)-2-methylmalate dehydratase small subunit